MDEQELKGASQKFVELKEIKQGTAVLKDGSLRAVLITSNMNFALKSSEEQNATIYSFQNFLNGLDFTLQILVQSRRLNIDSYLKYLEGLIPEQKTELLKLQTQDYIQFVRGMIELQNVMGKAFYVVVPMSRKPAEKLMSKGPLAKVFSKKKSVSADEKEMSDEEFGRVLGQLTLRVEQVLSGLRSTGIEARQLTSEEIFYLLTNVYNPGVVKKHMPISPDIKGFS
jgi:hypothetical protein